MYRIAKLNRILKQVKIKYLLKNSIVQSEQPGSIIIESSVQISNSKIYVKTGSHLKIGKGSVLKNVFIHVDGELSIGENNILEGGKFSKLSIYISKGAFTLGSYNRIKSKIMVRFGGLLTIGDHNNINDESEIRADERVIIGDYNQISYQCVIWDTNTHTIYDDATRRELTDKHFPIFGYEYERPKTKPVTIGSDCWIGRGVSILKGVELGSSSIVGYKTILSNCHIEERKVVVTKIDNTIFDRQD
ncbi:hypothetical protein [Spirosoma sp. 209]|uniref:acyltransferase n=1 Tax=Spirosoma sp. 209 TaxID=1955701 RepID=UPI00098D307C|nr:hypothetical protein [Spirosoma sp. 209]